MAADYIPEVHAAMVYSKNSAFTIQFPRSDLGSEYQSLVTLKYFAEGAANVLFRLTLAFLPDGFENSEEHKKKHRSVNGYLLRMRKGEKAPDWHPDHQSTAPPPYVSVHENHEFINTRIKSALPEEHLIPYVFVEVAQDVQTLCNTVLTHLEKEGKRPAIRRGWHIKKAERYAMLLPDMSAHDNNTLMVEFQPKLLWQSPCAPPDAVRCRTCAWHVKKGVSRRKRFCPLALVSGDQLRVRKQIVRFVPRPDKLPRGWDWEDVVDEIVRYFCSMEGGRDILLTLQRLQREWDAEGRVRRVGVARDFQSRSLTHLLAVAQKALDDPENEGFEKLSWAMTVRDCVIFVRLTKPPEEEPPTAPPSPQLSKSPAEQMKTVSKPHISIEARVADLDLKKADTVKLLKWAADEKGLAINGHYMARDDATLEGKRVEEVCMLATPEGRALYEKSLNIVP